MQQYLLSIYQPEGKPPPEVLGPIMADLDKLNAEMKAAGVWVFAAGLHPPASATVVRTQDGETLLTDGPFAEAKEFLGGFTVIAVPDLDAALRWAGKLSAVLSPLAIEVRPFVGDG